MAAMAAGAAKELSTYSMESVPSRLRAAAMASGSRSIPNTGARSRRNTGACKRLGKGALDVLDGVGAESLARGGDGIGIAIDSQHASSEPQQYRGVTAAAERAVHHTAAALGP